jgi:hypothetical protein
VSDHLDEDGNPCARHSPPAPEAILALATVGSRMPSFHHDAASKLQTLVMAVDEIGELADRVGDPDLRRASTTALTALRELHTMFNANRALTRAPQPARVSLGELVGRAAERAGLVVQGDVPAARVEVNVTALTHALAVLLDLAAGVVKLGRVVDLAAVVDGPQVQLRIQPPPGTVPTPPRGTELVTVAAFALVRDRGEMRCGRGEGFVIRLPIVT